MTACRAPPRGAGRPTARPPAPSTGPTCARRTGARCTAPFTSACMPTSCPAARSGTTTASLEHPVDDRAGRLAPTARPVAGGAKRGPPAQQISLARERDPRPAHPLVPGRLAERDHIRAPAQLKVVAQVRKPKRTSPATILVV